MPKKNLRQRSKLCKTGRSSLWKSEQSERVSQSGSQIWKSRWRAIVKLMKEQPRSETVSP